MLFLPKLFASLFWFFFLKKEEVSLVCLTITRTPQVLTPAPNAQNPHHPQTGDFLELLWLFQKKWPQGVLKKMFKILGFLTTFLFRFFIKRSVLKVSAVLRTQKRRRYAAVCVLTWTLGRRHPIPARLPAVRPAGLRQVQLHLRPCRGGGHGHLCAGHAAPHGSAQTMGLWLRSGLRAVSLAEFEQLCFLLPSIFSGSAASR